MGFEAALKRRYYAQEFGCNTEDCSNDSKCI